MSIRYLGPWGLVPLSDGSPGSLEGSFSRFIVSEDVHLLLGRLPAGHPSLCPLLAQ